MKTYLYTNKAPVGCNDCSGCDACCHMMGDTIIQDPYDLWNFCSHMKIAGGSEITFGLLISEDGPWELSEHDSLLLPNIKMVDDGVCPFLGSNKRCTIHSIRSGLCRLYPLARRYEESDSITYSVLPPELGCHKLQETGTPVLISEWLGIMNPDNYHTFLSDWHSVKKDMIQLSKSLPEKDKKNLQQIVLQIFYENPYQKDFYADFAGRMEIWHGVISRIL